MAEKKYVLYYGEMVICGNINMDNALILIEALCRKYYRERSHRFQLIEEELCQVVNDG